MLTRNQMLELFAKLNDKLKQQKTHGEICIVGGAAMCLAFNARLNTHDIDATFEPNTDIRLAALDLAKEEDLEIDWLNDAVNIFMPKVEAKKKRILKKLSNLTIWSPEAEYILAMKCISARPSDIRDIKFLINFLNIASSEEVIASIKEYYPKDKISKKSLDLILSIFEDANQ